MITQVENAILVQLKNAADSDRLRYRWATLESYPDDWPAYFRNLKGVLRAPAAWVTFAGFTGFADNGDGDVRAVAIFGVTIAARNARNETASRQGFAVPDGKKAEPGSYQLLSDIIGLLSGSDLGLDIDSLRCLRGDPVDTGEDDRFSGFSMFATAWQTALPIPKLTTATGDLADFQTFHANWDVPPFGNVDADAGTPGVQIPADETADATDNVELPQ